MSSRTDYFFKYQLRSLWPWFSDFGLSVSVLEPLSLVLGLGLGLEQMGLDNKSTGVDYRTFSTFSTRLGYGAKDYYISCASWLVCIQKKKWEKKINTLSLFSISSDLDIFRFHNFRVNCVAVRNYNELIENSTSK